MTDLTTKTAQSLHAEWCEQMREKGFHGPDEKCSLKDTHQFTLVVPRMLCEEGKSRCPKFHRDLIPWPDLDESRQQEYLSTAKAVLPEIVGEVFDGVINVIKTEEVFHGDHLAALMNLRDRRLKELKK